MFSLQVKNGDFVFFDWWEEEKKIKKALAKCKKERWLTLKPTLALRTADQLFSQFSLISNIFPVCDSIQMEVYFFAISR